MLFTELLKFFLYGAYAWPTRRPILAAFLFHLPVQLGHHLMGRLIFVLDVYLGDEFTDIAGYIWAPMRVSASVHHLSPYVPGPRSGGAGLLQKGGSLVRLAAPGNYRWLINPGHQVCLFIE